MILDNVPLNAIDFDNEIYRITEDLNLPPIIASIEAIGQQNPVLLLQASSSCKIIICGFRRLHALRRIGSAHAIARVVSDAECSPTQAFRIALLDNLSHRTLNALEKARTLSSLKNSCALDDDSLAETYLPLLGIEPNKKVLHQYLSIMNVDPRLRALHNAGILTLASVERIAGMQEDIQNDLLTVFKNIRLSSSLQRKFFDLVEDLAAIAETGPKEVLSRSELVAALEISELSRFQKGERILDLLHRWRNPRLAQVEEKFSADKKRLGLPGSVHLSHDPFFEKRQLTVEFTVSTAKQFGEMADELQRAAREPILNELMRMS